MRRESYEEYGIEEALEGRALEAVEGAARPAGRRLSARHRPRCEWIGPVAVHRA